MHGLVIFIAQYLILVPVVAVCYVLFRLPTLQAKKQFVLEGFVAVVLVLLLAKLGSMLFYNPRPFVVGHFQPYFAHGNDNGFPSDHTLLSSFLAMLVFYHSRKLGVALLVVAALIGASRVIAGVHHVIDIVGAFCISVIGVSLAVYLVRKIAAKRANVPAE